MADVVAADPSRAAPRAAPASAAAAAPAEAPASGGAARWNLVLSRACLPVLAACGAGDDAAEDVELLASNLCAALATEFQNKWLLCEVFTAQGTVQPRAAFASKFAAGSATEDAVPALRLKLGVTPDRACYGCMRPPRGHCCTRCLDVPIARVLRKGVESTFAPGIGLVGRCWATRRAEVLDLAVARCFPAAYVRAAAWDVGHLRTVVAVPISRRAAGGSAAFAVVLIYFGAALFRDRADGEVQRGLGAAMARAANAAVKRQRSKALCRSSLPSPPPSPSRLAHNAWPPAARNSPTARTSSGSPTLCGPPGPPVLERQRPVAHAAASTLEDSAADAAAAAKFDEAFGGRPAAQHDMAHIFGAYACAICFSTMENAFAIEGCGHSACRACLASWTALSPSCPSCHGHIDGVAPNKSVDEEIAYARRAATKHRCAVPPAPPHVLDADEPTPYSPTCVMARGFDSPVC
ncbi:hypothetical protein M885DRAFT_552537 [Pelagophyceae sp. CCMP2097]|nr:hypothetical protein M885DRAFT_552537 [Pelagophyceae sp. CCMP2097]